MKAHDASRAGGTAMVEEILNRMGQVQERASVKTVFGEPYQVNGRTVVPVAKFSYGYGFGGGRGERKPGDAEPGGGGSGVGGGGRVSVRPIAVLEMSGSETTVKPIVDVTRLAIAGMVLVAWNVFWITYTVRRVRGRQTDG
jgi:uncharacterized spore protein YtfJ